MRLAREQLSVLFTVTSRIDALEGNRAARARCAAPRSSMMVRDVALVGFALAILAKATGSLWPGVLLHAVYNAAVTLAT